MSFINRYSDFYFDHYCWLVSNHDSSTRQVAVMRLILWLTPLETSVTVPSTEMDEVSTLKSVMLGAAFAKTRPMALPSGTDADPNLKSALLMIEPLLNEVTVKEMNDVNALW